MESAVIASCREQGGLYGGRSPLRFPAPHSGRSLLDLARLWQAGFDNAVAALGSHLNPIQLSQLCQVASGVVYICFGRPI